MNRIETLTDIPSRCAIFLPEEPRLRRPARTCDRLIGEAWPNRVSPFGSGNHRFRAVRSARCRRKIRSHLQLDVYEVGMPVHRKIGTTLSAEVIEAARNTDGELLAAEWGDVPAPVRH